MKKIVLISLSLLIALSAFGLPIEKEGLKLHSEFLKQDVSYSVILPEDYDVSGASYPVLYMLHGIGGDESSWMEYGNVARVMQRMSDEGLIRQFIIVMPCGYQSYYCDTYDGSFRYESFFIKELIPYIDSHYRTFKSPVRRSVLGFSMGGFGALSVALRNRDIFGSVIGLSPSIRTDSQYEEEGPQAEWESQWGRIFGGIGKQGAERLTGYYLSHSPYHIFRQTPSENFKHFGIMLDIGDKEGTLCPANEELHLMLLKNNIRHVWEVRNGGHDFDCWNAALPKALHFADSCFAMPAQPSIPQSSIESASTEEDDEATLYLPSRNTMSQRKYPVIYVEGNDWNISRFVALYHGMSDSLMVGPSIICVIRSHDDINQVVSRIENRHKCLRGSQRMRALICVGDAFGQCLHSLQSSNLFSAIICDNPEMAVDSASVFGTYISRYNRYPRCFFEVAPCSPYYAFASKVHQLLREKGMEHEFRSRDAVGGSYLEIWEEWIKYIDKRIHI
jgi:enterochelin esterase-like enzyme